MNPRIKILVIENDCAKLISLMLWLDQFAEFEISGVAEDTHNLPEQMIASEPDVLLIDGHSMSAERLQCLKTLRAFPNAPAIVFIGEKAPADYFSSHDSDLYLTQTSSVKDLCESLRKANNRRRLTFATANMPMTKAG